MDLRHALRTETRPLHERLDGMMSTLDLATVEGYCRFLRVQARALPPIEQGLTDAGVESLIPGWRDNRRAGLLADDLVALGEPMPDAWHAPVYDSAAAMLGAAYVIEGSRLGGRILSKNVGTALPDAFMQARGQEKAWPALLSALKSADYSCTEVAEAVAAANSSFMTFIEVAFEVLADE